MIQQRQQLLDALESATAPAERIELIYDLVMEREYVEVDRQRSLELANEAVALASDGSDLHVALACMARALTYVSMNMPAPALADLERAEPIFIRLKDGVRLISIDLLKGRAYCILSDFSKAMSYELIALDAATRRNDELLILSAYCVIGLTLTGAGATIEAHAYAVKALQLAEEIGNAEIAAVSRMNVGFGYSRLGQPEAALPYLHESLRLYSETAQYSRAMGATLEIANVYFALNRPDETDEWAERALELATRSGAIPYVTGCLALRLKTALIRGDLEIAKAFAKRALKLTKGLGVQLEIPIRLALGEAHRRSGDTRAALRELKRALRDVMTIGSNARIAPCHYYLAKAHCSAGNTAEAIDAIERFHTARLAAENETTAQIVEWTLARLELERASREAEEIRRRSEEMAREIRNKEREMAELAQQLRERREMFTMFDTRLAEIERKATGTAGRMVQRLRDDVREQRDTTAGWGSFAQRVDETHLEFVRRLSAAFPSLTKGELKVCTLLRVNLSSQEIASLLGISLRSVESYRYRIHKKLALPERSSVVTFLAGL